ncbi:hypothetical protein ACFQV4_12260 [Streptomyces thermocarboxydus]
MEDDGAAPLVAPSAAVPELPGAATVARGARFAGAAAEAGPTSRRPRSASMPRISARSGTSCGR